MRVALIFGVVCFLVPATSEAGRSHFGWLYGVETIPERGVELETWILEENGKGGRIDETRLWFAPVVGITDRLELALPIEILFERENGVAETQIDRFGLEAHWRLMDPDPEISGPFAALLRLGAKRIVSRGKLMRIEPGVVLGLTLGPVHMAADLGGRIEIDHDGRADLEAQPGAGVSVAVWEELRLGAELYAEVGLFESTAIDWVAVGPTISWTHGRFWFSASLPFGLKGIDNAPRINWAIAF